MLKSILLSGCHVVIVTVALIVNVVAAVVVDVAVVVVATVPELAVVVGTSNFRHVTANGYRH